MNIERKSAAERLRGITLSPETRERVQKRLNEMVQDHCDYIAGKKDKKDFPGSFAAEV